MSAIHLLAPDAILLPQYLIALRTNWTPRSDDDPEGARDAIQTIEADPAAFLRSLHNPSAKGPPIALSNGTVVPRLAHVRYWVSDGSYCGEVNLRWQPGTTDLPAYCDGHVGYAVVPWKRRQGLATDSLRELARIAPRFGLRWLDIAMSAENLASRGVAEAAGAVFQEQYVASEQGGVQAVRYRLKCSDA